MNLWYDIDSPVIAAHEFPAVLIDLACSRDIEPDKLLRGTGIFMDDFLSGQLTIKPQQCLALIGNTQKWLPAADTAFLAGHRLYPGNFGPAGTALTQAPNLMEALQALQAYGFILTPLLTPRLSLDSEFAYLYWHESCAESAHSAFLRHMMMTAVTSLCRRLCGLSLPWEYFLPDEAQHPEQYAVNWGNRVRAGRHYTAMRLPRALLSTNCPSGSASMAMIARAQCERTLVSRPALGFIAFIDQCIRKRLPGHVSLELVADELQMSPATLKRKLKKHGSHFQQRYDTVRKELAIEWLTRKQLDVEEIALRLHFHDSRNLRRAFKRWTGVLPSAL